MKYFYCVLLQILLINSLWAQSFKIGVPYPVPSDYLLRFADSVAFVASLNSCRRLTKVTAHFGTLPDLALSYYSKDSDTKWVVGVPKDLHFFSGNVLTLTSMRRSLYAVMRKAEEISQKPTASDIGEMFYRDLFNMIADIELSEKPDYLELVFTLHTAQPQFDDLLTLFPIMDPEIIDVFGLEGMERGLFSCVGDLELSILDGNRMVLESGAKRVELYHHPSSSRMLKMLSDSKLDLILFPSMSQYDAAHSFFNVRQATTPNIFHFEKTEHWSKSSTIHDPILFSKMLINKNIKLTPAFLRSMDFSELSK